MGVVDPEFASSTLRLWIAAGSAALLVAACVLASMGSRANLARALERSGVIVLGAILGAVLAWSALDRGAGRNGDADRRTLELRAEELTAHSLAPGSALPCLDALAGEDVEAACEKALFASPVTVATATSYVEARLELLTDMVSYLKRGGGQIDTTLSPIRRSLEADRFGFLAHALAMRDRCTSQDCKALAVLNDATRVRSHLSAATLDRYLDRYLTAWAQPPENLSADATSAQPAGLAQTPHKMVNIDFPTAASIPAVSIMNPEPAAKAVPGAAAAAPAAASPGSPAADGTPQRKQRKQAANPPAPDAQGDPVWVPAPLAPAPQGASAAPAPAPTPAPAANFAAGASAPLQLMPSASPQ
jgi:hypothetical protein